jgi:biopolymer transport protein TolR
MNSAQVRGRARKAMGRREQEVEQDEIESGEINLVPYLDIVTNLMLFLLVSVSAGFLLGQINTTLPDHAPAAAAAQPADPSKNPDEQSLQLVVSVTRSSVILWSVTGLEGSLAEPRARGGRLPDRAGEQPQFDLAPINQALHEIASRRWRGKLRARDTYEIILQADGEVPYGTIIAAMDALRRKLPEPGKPDDFLGMPAEEEREGKRVATEPYDPDKHYLFPDILFSKGFE